MAQLVIDVVDTRDGTAMTVLLGRPDVPYIGVVGSDDACDVCLRDRSIAPQQARLYGAGNHLWIDIIDHAAPGYGAIVRFRDRDLPPGQRHRVDYRTFSIGPFQLTFGWSGEDDDGDDDLG